MHKHYNYIIAKVHVDFAFGHRHVAILASSVLIGACSILLLVALFRLVSRKG
jgi:hypothetical protein